MVVESSRPRMLKWMLLGACALAAVLVMGSAEAQTSPANPLRDDGDDGGGIFADVEELWIAADDGASEFEVHWRVPYWDETSASPASAKESLWLAKFTFEPTGVRYAAGAHMTTGPFMGGVGLFWEYALYVEDTATADERWCRIAPLLPASTLADTDGDGISETFEFHIGYDMLNVATAPPIVYTVDAALDGPVGGYGGGCDPYTTGPPAVAGDLTTDWEGAMIWSYGGSGQDPVESCPGCGDVTDAGTFDQDYTLGGSGPPTPDGGACQDDPGFVVVATMAAVEHPYVDIPDLAITYPGATGQDIPIVGCVQEVEPTTCYWEAAEYYDKNIHGQYVEPLPVDGAAVFADPHACATEVRYKYPGVYLVRLHGIDGDGRYATDHALVHVAAAVDYEGPMGQQGSGDDVADPPRGRVDDIPSSHDASVTITRDRDRDGVDDGADTLIGSSCEWVPHDGTDEDRDGIPDACDPDWDNDDVLNAWDNCPWTANTAQKDADGDGHGDACASDADKDGVRDARDNCPRFANGPLAPRDRGVPLDDQGDLDGDGLGDACDPDMDGDHVPDAEDAFPRDRSEWSDLDEDGIGDNADLDRDGDGASNTEELAVGTDPDLKSDRPSDARLAALRDGEAASVGGISIPGTIAVAAGVVLIAIVLAVILRPKRH